LKLKISKIYYIKDSVTRNEKIAIAASNNLQNVKSEKWKGLPSNAERAF